MTAHKLPPAVVADIPEELEPARDYFDSHDLSGLMADGVVVVTREPVGVQEIDERAGVSEVTVRQWKRRYPGFPRSRWTVSGQPAWDWHEVRVWVRKPRRPGRPRKQPSA
jgi:hypothetical protein